MPALMGQAPVEQDTTLTFDQGEAGRLKNVLESGLADDFDRPANLDDYIQSSPFALEAQRFADDALVDLDRIMGDIAGYADDAAFNTDALVARLDETFQMTQGKMMDSALASSQKAAYEMDSYLGSAGSDARSVVRRGMAASVTGNILSQTQKNIAQLYTGHVDKVVETTLTGAKINADIKMDAAKALADLAGKGAEIILGTNSAILQSYNQSVNVGIELIKAKSAMLTNIYGAEGTRMQTKAKLLTDPVYARNTATASFSRDQLAGHPVSQGMLTGFAAKAAALSRAGFGSF